MLYLGGGLYSASVLQYIIVVVCQMKMTHDDRYMVTASDDYCAVLWKVIDRDGRGKKVDREIAYSQEILIPKSDLQEKVFCHSYCCCCYF